MKAPICPFKVTLGRLLGKSAYKVDFLWDKWILYKRFLLYLGINPALGLIILKMLGESRLWWD